MWKAIQWQWYKAASRDGSNYFATVKAKPLAELDRLRYLLLLWPSNLDMSKVKSMSPEEVRRLVQQRLESQAHEATHSVSKTKITDDQADSTQPHTGKEILDPEIQPQCLNKRSRFLQISNNIGKKTNARAFYFSMGDHFMLLCCGINYGISPMASRLSSF